MTTDTPSGPGRIAALSTFLLLAASPLGAQADSDEERVHDSARHRFRVVTVADGLEHPWSLAWLPDGRMLITERPGRLRVVEDGELQADPIAGTPEVWANGQGGLLEVLPHPDFAANRLIYLSYSKPGDDGEEATTALVRGRLEGDRLRNVEELFVADAWTGSGAHFAGRMFWDGEGHLFLAVGDRGADPDLLAEQAAQDPSNHQGTVLRLTEDGEPAPGNPFAGRGDVRPEIWSYGHRNPQGLVMHPETGEIWDAEHGPRGGDEVNVVRPGANYGWPVVSYGVNYDGTIFTRERRREGLEDPVWVWVPSIATSGMTIYDGDPFPWWKGSVFVGGLAGEVLSRLTVDGHRVVSEERLLEGELGRIRDVRQGPDGYIYLAVDHRAGQPTAVVRLEPAESRIETP